MAEKTKKGDCSIGALLLYLLGMVGIIVISAMGQKPEVSVETWAWWFGFVFLFLMFGSVWTGTFLLYLSVGWERNERED